MNKPVKMRRNLIFCLILVFVLNFIISTQAQEGKPDFIKSGFYLKLGAVLPVGKYAAGQKVTLGDGLKSSNSLEYLPAKIGGAMDMGYLIYIGPSFANNILRAGIDATFLSFWFNSTKPVSQSSPANHYYYFIGQKFGPLITINPVDRLMIDLSWKLNANFGYFEGEWESLPGSSFSKYGADFVQQEISLGLRYRIIVFSFSYNFGKMTYDNFDKSRPKQTIDVNTVRIMIGFKF